MDGRLFRFGGGAFVAFGFDARFRLRRAFGNRRGFRLAVGLRGRRFVAPFDRARFFRFRNRGGRRAALARVRGRKLVRNFVAVVTA